MSDNLQWSKVLKKDNEQITINGYTNTVSLAKFGKRTKREKPPDYQPPPKRWYIRKTSTSLNKIATLIKKIYEYQQNKAKPLLWLTLTTQQYRTTDKLSNYSTDKQLLYCFKKFVQHGKFGYLSVVERQRLGGDLHFHLVLVGSKAINIPRWLNKWAKLLNVEPHPALLEVKPVYELEHLSYYISKYIRKSCPRMETIEKQFGKYKDKFKPPYSSIFQCRTFTTGRLYNFISKEDKMKISIPSEYMVHLGLDYKNRKYTDNVLLFNYTDDLYKKAVNIKKMLHIAGLVEF